MSEKTHKALRLLSRSRGRSLAALVREALDLYVNAGHKGPDPPGKTDDPFLEVIGIAKGGPSDRAVNHDSYLYGRPKRERSGGKNKV